MGCGGSTPAEPEGPPVADAPDAAAAGSAAAAEDESDTGPLSKAELEARIIGSSTFQRC